MSARSKLLCVALLNILSYAALAHDDPRYENRPTQVGDYETLARSWWPEAMLGDAEKQERLAALLLGPHARQAKAAPYDGIHFLFRAAVNGRRMAMLRLAEALNNGKFGVNKDLNAGRCWASVPADLEGRLTCVKLTDFRDPHARVSCDELAVIEAQEYPGARDGAAMAKLCLANKTPAILVFGLPPSRQDLERVSEYKRYGIEWSITGDVYDEKFEIFREKFNQTTVEALEANYGRGYLDRLAKKIEARLSRK